MTLHNRYLDQDASIQEHLKFQMFCNRMFSPMFILRSIFSEIQTFAHIPQTHEGRRCLHNFVV